MEIYTIGFTKKSAAGFFGALTKAGIGRLIDVRLNNVSQLAGFSKRDDLAFFLAELCDADYVHEPLLAPESDMLKAYHAVNRRLRQQHIVDEALDMVHQAWGALDDVAVEITPNRWRSCVSYKLMEVTQAALGAGMSTNEIWK